MNIDVILSWPRNTDFPLWREWMRINRGLFKKVIIVFTETHQGDDYQSFIRSAMAQDDITFVDIQPTPPGRDWRDVAVNKGLEYSDAEWVWFTEQDFIAQPEFWEKMRMVVLNKRAEMCGVYDAQRLHPCSILIERKLLDKTSKNFGIVPGELDHFGLIQKDLEAIQPTQAYVGEMLYNHMNGLTHNMTLVYNGEKPNYKPEVFDKYLEFCLQVQNVPLDERFVKLCTQYLQTSTTQAS